MQRLRARGEAGTGRHGTAQGAYLDDVDAEVVVALARAAAEVVPRHGGHTRGNGGGLTIGRGASHRDGLLPLCVPQRERLRGSQNASGFIIE